MSQYREFNWDDMSDASFDGRRRGGPVVNTPTGVMYEMDDGLLRPHGRVFWAGTDRSIQYVMMLSMLLMIKVSEDTWKELL